MMTYHEEEQNRVKELLNEKHITEEDYLLVWRTCVTQKANHIQEFGETDLATVIVALDKVNFRTSSRVYGNRWQKDVLLDKDFIDFVKKYEEKILQPGSELPDEMKRQEHQTLIFTCVCELSAGTMMSLLSDYKKENADFSEYGLLKYNLLDFLGDINKGTASQKLECLVSVDKLLDVYPETREALSKFCEAKEPISFLDMISHVLMTTDDNYSSNIVEFKKLIEIYNNQKELETSLKQKEEAKPKKLKL